MEVYSLPCLKKKKISVIIEKQPFLMRSSALFAEIIPRARTQQGLVFRKQKAQTKDCQS